MKSFDVNRRPNYETIPHDGSPVPRKSAREQESESEEMAFRIEYYNRSRITKCRDCGAEILFLKKMKGNALEYHIPVNVESTPIHEKIWIPKYGRHRCVEYDSTRVFVSQDVIDESKEYQRKVMAKLPDKSNYQGSVTKWRYAIGYRGEWAFREWCKANGIEYKHKFCIGTNPDADFTIYINDERRTVDIKTTTTKKGELSISAQQFDRVFNDLYIAVTLTASRGGEMATIIGGISRVQINKESALRLEKRGNIHAKQLAIPYKQLPLRMSLIARKAKKQTGIAARVLDR